MDEDLYKKYKASCISDISVCSRDRQNRKIFCRGIDNDINEDKDSVKEIYEKSNSEAIAQALQICDYNTIFLSNIISENNKENNSSPELFVPSTCDYFQRECNLNISKMSRHNIKNIRNNFTLPTDTNSSSIRKKIYSEFRGVTEKKLSNKVLRRTIYNFPVSYVKSKNSSLKRKFELCEKNESDIRLDNRNKNKSKSSAYLKKSDNIFSYYKHFKSDDSGPISKNSREELFFKSRFINEINSVESYYSFKQMKNIEIQSSPVRIRIATNIGEDSIEYVDPTMEVELDSAESDPDDPEEPNEHNYADNVVEDYQLHSDLVEDSHLSNTEDNTTGENESNPVADDIHSKGENNDEEVLNENEKTTDISNPDFYASVDALQSNQTDNDERELKEMSKEENRSESNIQKHVEESISDIENRKNIMVEIEVIENIEKDDVNSTQEKLSKDSERDELNTELFKQAKINSSGESKDPLAIQKLPETKKELSEDTDKTYQDSMSKKQNELFERVELKNENEALIQQETESKNPEYFTKNDENEENERKERVEELQKTEERQNDADIKEKVISSIGSCNSSGDNMNFKEISQDIKYFETLKEDEVTDFEKEEVDTVQEKETFEELASVVLYKLPVTSETFENEERTEETGDSVMENEDFASDEKAMESKVISKVTDLDTEQESDERGKEENCERKFSEDLNNDVESKKTNGEYFKKIKGDEKPDMKANEFKDVEAISIKSVNELENVLVEEHEKVDIKSSELSGNGVVEEEDIDDEKKCVEDCKSDTTFDRNAESLEEVRHKEKENDVVKEDVEVFGMETAVYREKSESIFEEHSEIEENEDAIAKKAPNNTIITYETAEAEKTESKTNTETDYVETVLENENQGEKVILKKKEDFIIEPDSCENSSHQITDNEEDSLERDSLENADKEEISEEKQIDIESSESSRENVNFEKELQTISGKKSVIESTEINTEIIDTNCKDNSISKIDTENAENTENDEQNYKQLKSSVEFFSNEMDEAEKQQTYVNVNEKAFSFQDKGSNETGMESGKLLDTSAEDKAEKYTDDTKCPEEPAETSINVDLEPISYDQVLAEEQTKTCEHQDFDLKNSQINFNKELIRSFEKPKSDKTNQSTTDSAKLISPRKGIKVEDDEIETAISSVMFYDEMSDGNEQILNTVSSTERNKPFDGFEIDILSQQPESSKLSVKDSTSDLISVKYDKEHLPFPENEEDKVVLDEATLEENINPKKRKKKRKARSRSVQKGGLMPQNPCGASSASKKTQDSKGSASKNGTRTTRSVSSTSARSPSVGEKKIPPIKAPVGTTPPPKVKQARSKIGSLDNMTHKPKGGDKKVETVKLEWNAKSKVGSLDYVNHKPSGGDKKILTQKVDFKNVQSKVGSKDNLKHKAGGGNLKISTEKLSFKEKAAPKIGSLDNAKHKPGGGNVVIKSEKLHFKETATPKIHSKSGSERGSSHGGSETQSPVMPSSPAPQEELPPLNEDESPSQEEPKPEKADCNGGAESAPADPSNEASPTKSPEKSENATGDQLIAF